MTWRNDSSCLGDEHWYPTPGERRARALAFAANGDMQGYLAYQKDRIVGLYGEGTLNWYWTKGLYWAYLIVADGTAGDVFIFDS